MRAAGALLILAFGLPLPTFAEVATGKVFGNHMVLQRGAPIPIFGTAAANEAVSVTRVNTTPPPRPWWATMGAGWPP